MSWMVADTWDKVEQSWEDSSDQRSIEAGNSILHHDKGMKTQQIISQGSNETT